MFPPSISNFILSLSHSLVAPPCSSLNHNLLSRYESIYRMCECKCGQGFLRKDTEYHPNYANSYQVRLLHNDVM